MRTSGRVQFAAATVIIALLGLFVMRITFFNGIAVAAAVTVFMVMVGALLLLPAVLSMLGTWAFVGRMAGSPTGKRSRGAAVRRLARLGAVLAGTSAGSSSSRLPSSGWPGAGSRTVAKADPTWPSAFGTVRLLARSAGYGRHGAGVNARGRDPDAVSPPGLFRRLGHP